MGLAGRDTRLRVRAWAAGEAGAFGRWCIASTRFAWAPRAWEPVGIGAVAEGGSVWVGARAVRAVGLKTMQKMQTPLPLLLLLLTLRTVQRFSVPGTEGVQAVMADLCAREAIPA
jgi:hypothetical protein